MKSKWDFFLCFSDLQLLLEIKQEAKKRYKHEELYVRLVLEIESHELNATDSGWRNCP